MLYKGLITLHLVNYYSKFLVFTPFWASMTPWFVKDHL